MRLTSKLQRWCSCKSIPPVSVIAMWPFLPPLIFRSFLLDPSSIQSQIWCFNILEKISFESSVSDVWKNHQSQGKHPLLPRASVRCAMATVLTSTDPQTAAASNGPVGFVGKEGLIWKFADPPFNLVPLESLYDLKHICRNQFATHFLSPQLWDRIAGLLYSVWMCSCDSCDMKYLGLSSKIQRQSYPKMQAHQCFLLS